MRRLLMLLLALLLFQGCALFTKPTDRLSVERQKFINAYARARVTYQHLHARLEALCRVEKLARETCANIAAIDHQVKALDAEIQAKINTPESEIDWERIMKLMELTLRLVL